MNGLSLRISSDKKVRPIKKDVQKEDIMSLLNPDYESQLKFFEKLLAADSIEDQVQTIKEVFVSILQEEGDYGNSSSIIEALIHIYLSIKPKSPLSPPLLKFLSTIPEQYHDIVQNCFLKLLKIKLEKPKPSLNEVHEYSISLQLCLDNKQSLRVSLHSCLPEILNFLENSLRECQTQLQVETAPVKKLSIINGIHSCIQVGISIFQQYSIRAEEELCRIVVDIVCNSDIPIDTQAAAGVLAAHLSSSLSPQEWIKTFQTILDKQNELGILSFCSGLLIVLTPDELQMPVTLNGSSDKTLNFLYKTIVGVEEKNATESGIVLAATRCIVLLTRSLLNLPHLMTGELLNSLLVYLWNHIEHFMDAVRHLALSALTNIESIAKANPDLCIFEQLTKDLEGMSIERRSKHAAISVLVSHVRVDTIISQSPGLVNALLKSALGNPSSNYAITTLERLMQQDFKEQVDKEKWFEIWIEPLLQAELSAPLEQLLATALKIHCLILEKIASLGLDENTKNIPIILTCLKIGRKLNLLKDKDDNEKWKDIVDLHILDICMYHSHDDVRLSCFSLLVETSKSTEAFTSVELNLIKKFFIYNFVNQEPSVRQKSLASSKKFLTRLRDSRGALMRKQRNKHLTPDEAESILSLLKDYSNIVKELQNMCLDSLFPGSSPPRRSFAFGTLALFKELGFWTDFDNKTVQVLLPCLLDSYEENKEIAKNLLACMPLHLLKFEDEDHLKKYLRETLKLSSSIRPPDSISAAYYMSLLASFNEIKNEPNMVYSTPYFCLTTILESLMDELRVAKESLLQAACSGPLYGHLFVIRHLLQSINLKDIGVCSKWQCLVQKIIDVAFECNGVVSHVVYNSSPEGHLPMDLSYSYRKKDTDPQVTSQMVLLCAWRTVKEVSLLLGELADRATIVGDDSDNGLLSQRQILAIGEHLTGLLSETKHRGAFEQAYLGFSKLAARLWRCKSGELHELPRKWLDETLKCISTNENLSATRRSAGIPFIVQALICSELDSGSCKSLHRAMSSLLQIAHTGSPEGRVHALNILRALYRGSSLGEAVGPYVADGIATAIAGFNSNTWAERNSSTLLLSALMSRVFGVPRGKSETLSWRNKMTGRLFFQRYPNLYTELLSHLEASSKNYMYPALYPVLLLLGRLYPSSLEGTDSNLQLMNYLPYVMRCSESSILKTRSLAATAVSSLITSALHVDYVSQLMETISHIKKENHKHGLLLMVLKLIQQANTLENLNIGKVRSDISTWLKILLDCLTSSSFVSKDTSIQIILHLVSYFYEEIPLSDKNSVEHIVKSILFDNSGTTSVHQYGCEIFYVHSSVLLLTLAYKAKKTDDFLQYASALLQSSSYEVFGVASELLNYLLSQEVTCFSPSAHESLKLELNDQDFTNVLKEKVLNSQEIKSILVEKVLQEDNHHEDMLKLLNNLQYFPDAFQMVKNYTPVQFLYKICKNSPSSVSYYTIKCFDGLLSYQGEDIRNSDVDHICDVIDEFSCAEATDDCREAIAQLLAHHFYTLLQKSSLTSKLSLWTASVRLVVDEVPNTRQIICSGLAGNVLPSRGLEVLLNLFVIKSELQLAITGLLFWAVGEDLDFEDNSDECLFDKGPTNTYYEELILNRLACKHLAALSKNNGFFNLTLKDDYSQWLCNKTKIIAQSVTEFINNYKNSVTNCDNVKNLLPYRPCENKYLLQSYKIENLLQVAQGHN